MPSPMDPMGSTEPWHFFAEKLVTGDLECHHFSGIQFGTFNLSSCNLGNPGWNMFISLDPSYLILFSVQYLTNGGLAVNHLTTGEPPGILIMLFSFGTILHSD